MKLKPEIRKDFLDLFYNEIDNRSIDDKGTILNLHILKIENKNFDYHSLLEKLSDSIVSFALSRKELADNKKNRGIYVKAIRKLRNYKSNEGELGELLLYCFLEAHLEAPKIFTKFELKTSTQDYVKGSDGVHLLEIDKNNYQLIFGESKLIKNLKDGLNEALKSINLFVHRKQNNINHEIRLLNTHLEREIVNNKELYNFLKKIIMPSAKEDIYNRDNAFGIFAGYNLDFPESYNKLSNEEFRIKLREKIRNEVEENIENIKQKIRENGLEGYNFYIYIFPFKNLASTRKRVIRNLKGASNDF